MNDLTQPRDELLELDDIDDIEAHALSCNCNECVEDLVWSMIEDRAA